MAQWDARAEAFENGVNVLDDAIGRKLIADTGTGGVNHATTGATGGIYQFGPPESAGFPRIHFQEILHTAQYSFQTLSADHVYYQYTAFAVDENEPGAITAGRLADRVRTVLTDPVLTVTGKATLYCRFDRSIPSSREWDGKRFIYQRGGYVEVWLA